MKLPHLNLTAAKRVVLWVFMITVFVSGMLFCVFGDVDVESVVDLEAFESSPQQQDPLCPDMLVNEGGKYKLFFSNAASVDGANPVVFDSLQEYTDYQQAQVNAGRACPPPIYSQKEEDAQGKEVYRMYSSPYSVDGGLPALPIEVRDTVDASRENPPYNANQYAGIASLDMDEGVYTQLDQIHDQTKRDNKCPSYNAMDSNWGGVDYSQAAVQSGKFADNEVFVPLYPNFSPK